MIFKLKKTREADAQLVALATDKSKQGIFNQVRKVLGYLQTNPRHPSLRTHEFQSLVHPWDSSRKVFEAYVQNKSPNAYRVFWCYGPEHREITIISITPHP